MENYQIGSDTSRFAQIISCFRPFKIVRFRPKRPHKGQKHTNLIIFTDLGEVNIKIGKHWKTNYSLSESAT